MFKKNLINKKVKGVKVPKHIAIIMDGNGRWAEKRGYPRIYGHVRGAKAVKATVKIAAKKQIKYLTLFALSTENWKRPQEEINILMKLLSKYLDSEIDTMMQNNIRLRSIGQTQKLPIQIQNKLKNCIETTSNNKGMTLTLALNYGGKQEIKFVTQRIVRDVLSGQIKQADITEDLIDQHLETSFLPNPDIIIRSSGEKRLSNFLLWKASYAELFFIEKQWPDFSEEDLNYMINAYHKRKRRFGGICFS